MPGGLETAANVTDFGWRGWCAREPERGRPRRRHDKAIQLKTGADAREAWLRDRGCPQASSMGAKTAHRIGLRLKIRKRRDE